MRVTTPFWVGNWHVNPDSGRLLGEGKEVRLEPKVMEVLVYLAQHPNTVISRETLESEVWSGMIVGYEAVSQSIIKLRKALNDNSRNPQYIETISKKGYRLIAPVSAESAKTNESIKLAATSNKIISITAVTGLIALIGLIFFGTRDPSLNTPATDQIPSVVVLPFKNLSDDPKQEYLSDGITDDLITELSRLNSIRVIAHQSSDHYKNNPTRIEDIAQQLDVLYIVKGSIRKSGNHIRINVQLTNSKKGESIWAERFDIDSGEIFKVQDAISKNVIQAMTVNLPERKTTELQARGTINFEAYDTFLVGQQHMETRSREGYELTINAYREAIRIDPSYARAYGALAVTLTRGYRYQWTDLSLVEARERALELAKRAVALDQTTPQIYWSLGYVHLHRREFDQAEAAVKKAIALSPNYADGYALLANLANWRGKAIDAINYINKAAEINPYYTFQYPSTLGIAYYNLSRYNEAVIALRDALDRNENALNPRLYLAATYVKLHHMDDANWEIKQISVNRPGVSLSTLSTILPYESKHLMDNLLKDLRKAGLQEGN